MKKIVQFDWRTHWQTRVVPLLKQPLIQKSLELAMLSITPNWQPGIAPWTLGDTPATEPRPDDVSWYQPLGQCHDIALFSMAIGAALYPKLEWRFLRGSCHTVPVGYDKAGDPYVVMDILWFEQLSAEQSIAWCRRRQCPGYRTPKYDDDQGLLYSQFVRFILPGIQATALAYRPGKWKSKAWRQIGGCPYSAPSTAGKALDHFIDQHKQFCDPPETGPCGSSVLDTEFSAVNQSVACCQAA